MGLSRRIFCGHKKAADEKKKKCFIIKRDSKIFHPGGCLENDSLANSKLSSIQLPNKNDSKSV